MRRVLRPGGRLIASVQHPFADFALRDPRPDYSATASYTDEFTYSGPTIALTFRRRPLHAMPGAFTAAGFRITALSEPQPDPAARELFPEDYRILPAGIGFLFFAAESPAEG
ncbi:hypothetical protein GCM10027440_20760 [Nocardiopsis coralliicola]